MRPQTGACGVAERVRKDGHGVAAGRGGCHDGVTWSAGRDKVFIGRADDMTAGACLLLITSSIVSGMRRGPHHPQGHQPLHLHHHHYRPSGKNALTADSELLHDLQHLEEDSKVITPELLANMSSEELEFHYFSAHDFDRNSKLDGSEMLKAVYHTSEHQEHSNHSDNGAESPGSNKIEIFVDLVDRTLSEDDTNDDGFLSYAEYRAARSRNSTIRTSGILVESQPARQLQTKL